MKRIKAPKRPMSGKEREHTQVAKSLSAWERFNRTHTKLDGGWRNRAELAMEQAAEKKRAREKIREQKKLANREPRDPELVWSIAYTDDPSAPIEFRVKSYGYDRDSTGQVTVVEQRFLFGAREALEVAIGLTEYVHGVVEEPRLKKISRRGKVASSTAHYERAPRKAWYPID